MVNHNRQEEGGGSTFFIDLLILEIASSPAWASSETLWRVALKHRDDFRPIMPSRARAITPGRRAFGRSKVPCPSKNEGQGRANLKVLRYLRAKSFTHQ